MASRHSLITAERLREIVIYDPETGVFTWRIARGKCAAGARVGCPRKAGEYWVARLDYRMYYLHRLAWLYVTGQWPADDVDHRDLNKSNNRWKNLRPATQKQNNENMKLAKNNASGYRGVAQMPASSKWRARIRHFGRDIHLGYFATKESAFAARLQAEKELFTHSPVSELQFSCPGQDAAHETAEPAPES